MNTQIPTRSSGPSGIQVSELSLGSWHTWSRATDEEVMETVRIAIEAGVTLFDIGIYGDLNAPKPTSTDVTFARAVQALGLSRDSYQLAVKAFLPDPHRKVGGITEQIDDLLRRHGTDHAEFIVLGDLMFDPENFVSILEEVKRCIDAGKARAWATNNWSAADMIRVTEDAASIGLQAPDYVQHKYGITRRSVPEGAPYAELCERTGLTIQASDTFEGGLIFGPRTDGTARKIGGDIGGTQAQIVASVDRLRDVAAELGGTVAQLAIAFPLTNPHTSNVLIGSRTPEQTRENIGAFDLLRRHSAETIREAVADFWFDRDVVSADSSWGTRPGDDVDTYVVEER